jgi:hypothetical protein
MIFHHLYLWRYYQQTIHRQHLVEPMGAGGELGVTGVRIGSVCSSGPTELLEPPHPIADKMKIMNSKLSNPALVILLQNIKSTFLIIMYIFILNSI